MNPTRCAREPTRALLLPGSGSDEVFVRAVFAPALATLGVELVAAAPAARSVVRSGHEAADRAAAQPGPLLVGGISLGAAVATSWALAHRGRIDGLLLVMPAWWGDPTGSPAAAGARSSAAALRRDGLPRVLAAVAATTPGWLSDELARAWGRYATSDPGALVAALETAAHHVAPTVAELAGLDLPVGIVAVADDPLHPRAVALQASEVLPRAACEHLRLSEVGADPAVVGYAAVRALRRAGWVPAAQVGSGPVSGSTSC
ncbi:MAG: alpha/beta hydrolase [Mycobacteriaceae bacterium]